jgi:UDP-N-acetylmuramate: L-alanyl-gamma-D-glutamyl-meso-diaminopimelate ligase
VESFGIEEPDLSGHPRWRTERIEYGPDGTAFDVYHGEARMGGVRTPLSGAFNVRNSLAALAAASALGADWDRLVEGLRTLKIVRRRGEVRGEVRGVTVIDDFAHHPTAVRETITATRQRFVGRRVVAIFEPCSYTAQLRQFQQPYREALGNADLVVLAGLFHPERYDANTGLDPEELANSLRADGVDTDYIPEVDRIVDAIVSAARPGDVLLVMSNGGFGGIHEKLLATLGREEG